MTFEEAKREKRIRKQGSREKEEKKEDSPCNQQ
jgi:hypothetical protein